MQNSYEEKIRNYGNQIESYDTIIEAIRHLPGMYIGSKGNQGWITCFREIFQNAIDEAIKDDSPCNHVSVIYDERDQSAIVSDNGRGIPHGQIIRIYNTEHTSGNYTKELGKYSSGVNGIGAVCAVAFSSYFEVNSYVLGEAHQVKFVEGFPITDEVTIECPKDRQGTTVIMRPSIETLGDINISCQEIFDMVFKIFPLTNLNTIIDFKGINSKGKVVIDENLVNKDGILSNLYLKTQTPLIAPICFKADNGTMKAEIAFTYDMSAINMAEDITSYSNFTPTMSGTHVNGFLDGACAFFRNYMNKIYLGEKSKLSVVSSDVKSGLKAIVVVAHINPIFIGQSKASLTNEDMHPFVRDLTYKSLEQWSKQNSGDLQKLCKFFKDIAEIRSKSDESKVKLSSSFKTNLLTGKPKKYIQPSGTQHLELIIVEGDSALGSARNSRDYKCQGLFPVRGKIPNAFETEKSKFLANEEIASIITIIGGGYGKSFDINKVKWEKIIIASDADPDGAHIKTLFLRFFLLYMPELIASGKVFGAMPPLYGIHVNGGMKYFTTTLDFTKYVQNVFSKQHTVYHMTNVKLTTNELTKLLYTNIDYNYNINLISTTYAIDPMLLQSIMFKFAMFVNMNYSMKESSFNHVMENYMNNVPVDKSEAGIFMNSPITGLYEYSISENFDFKSFKKSIENEYKFIKVSMVNNYIHIEGLVNSKYQYIFLNERFISSCRDLISIIKKNSEIYYKLDDKIVSIYELMKVFENINNGIKLERFKGLGEQNPDELAESVLLPNSFRTLVKYTINDVKEEIGLIRYIDSNSAMLLNDISVTRQDIE